jgi:polyisoprenoid-binding protein YceI
VLVVTPIDDGLLRVRHRAHRRVVRETPPPSSDLSAARIRTAAAELDAAAGRTAPTLGLAYEQKMARWFLEPGHTAAEFSARHMMVTNVRGQFKNVHGKLDFDENDPRAASVEVTLDARGLSTGLEERDAHLRSADFLDVEHHPEIRFAGTVSKQLTAHDYEVAGDLTIRGITHPAKLHVRYLSRWETPWWEGGVDKGPKVRAGFVATTTINRHDFGVSWNAALDLGGVVVGDDVDIIIDAEAVREDT